MLASVITAIPGSSRYFLGGIIAYSNQVKIKQVGIKASTLASYGAVSPQIAGQMAKNIRRLFKTSLGLAITGIAGPDGGTKNKPVGTVYIAVASSGPSLIKHYCFRGSRHAIREQACAAALRLIKQSLSEKG